MTKDERESQNKQTNKNNFWTLKEKCEVLWFQYLAIEELNKNSGYVFKSMFDGNCKFNHHHFLNFLCNLAFLFWLSLYCCFTGQYLYDYTSDCFMLLVSLLFIIFQFPEATSDCQSDFLRNVGSSSFLSSNLLLRISFPFTKGNSFRIHLEFMMTLQQPQICQHSVLPFSVSNTNLICFVIVSTCFCYYTVSFPLH